MTLRLGTNPTRLNIGQVLAEGIYIVRITSDHSVKTLKLIKQK